MDLQWSPYGLSYGDILRLIAPRPFFEVTGALDYVNCQDEDPALTTDQRLEKKRAAHTVARAVYGLYGEQDALGLWGHDGGHCFPKAGREAAYAFLRRRLVHKGSPDRSAMTGGE